MKPSPLNDSATMKVITGLFHSSVGKKYIMAGTGLALFFFVVGHLLGNLQIFLGPEAINAYGAFLHGKKEMVWGARIGLLVMVGLHIWSAIKLSAENRAARPVGYGEYKPKGSSFASRTMLMSGLIILSFIIYHLLHFTVQAESINFTGRNFETMQDAKGRHDIYSMMVVGFRNPLVSLFYVISMTLLMLHLRHGLASMFQSLGWTNRKYGPAISKFALIASIILIIGYSSIPIAVLTGIIR
ncbi:MAG: succinate dehydrogenase cytochrome b subunit [Verrucomicrobiales bacterium]